MAHVVTHTETQATQVKSAALHKLQLDALFCLMTIMACYVVRATFVAGAAVAEEFCKIDQFESKIRRDVTVHDLHINRRRRRRRRSFDQQGLSGWWNVSKVAGKIDFELRNESCSHFFSRETGGWWSRVGAVTRFAVILSRIVPSAIVVGSSGEP